MAASASQTTTNHNQIVQWAKERGGKPGLIQEPGKNRNPHLQINFEGYAAHNLKELSWDEFFRIFDEKHLQFQYQEETEDGTESRMARFISKDN